MLRYIYDIFFTCKHGQEKLEIYLEDLNKCHPNLKFTSDLKEVNVAFLDLKVKQVKQNRNGFAC